MLSRLPKRYEFEGNEDRTTAHAGLLPLVGLMQKIDLLDWVDDTFDFYRSNRAYQPHEYMFTLIANKASGGDCLQDSRAVSQDETLQYLLELDALPAPNTLGDWLRSADGMHAHRLRRWNRYLCWQILEERGCKTLHIDIDAKVHVSDNKNAEWTYKKQRGYCPLYATAPKEKLVLEAFFRPGSSSPAEHNASMVRTFLKSCPEWLEKLEVTLDAAGWQIEVIEALQRADDEREGLDINFYIRPSAVSDRPQSRVRDAIATIEEDEWSDWEPKGSKKVDPRGRQLAETVITIGEAAYVEAEAMRLVVVREPMQKAPSEQVCFQKTHRYRYMTVATNNLDLSAQQVIKRYDRRGAAEDVIGEIVADGRAERFPLQSDKANALYLGINILTFNLLQYIKDHGLPPKWKPLTHASLQKRVLNIAIRVSKHAGYKHIKFSKSFPWVEEFKSMLEACWGHS